MHLKSFISSFNIDLEDVTLFEIKDLNLGFNMQLFTRALATGFSYMSIDILCPLWHPRLSKAFAQGCTLQRP